jgi:hypothetical protein
VGFNIAEYQYTGFGSIYFVDFILFHKLLGINKLTSVEYDNAIHRRVMFNKPFREVEVVMAPVSDVIPTLKRDYRHILWLDYDDVIRRTHLDDVLQAASQLSVGSILLVTVDVEPPAGDGPSEWRQHYEAQAADYLGAFQGNEDFEFSNLPLVNAILIDRAIKRGLAGREVEFLPLFSFLYKDGHRMLTVGGMLATATEKRWLRGSSISEAPYYRDNLSKKAPYKITVPRLTRKERLYLDASMPCGETWSPDAFELPQEDILAYREIYRFFPAYAELLL